MSQNIQYDDYTCYYCQQTYEKTRSDKEALEEYENKYGTDDAILIILCDDCYNVVEKINDTSN